MKVRVNWSQITSKDVQLSGLSLSYLVYPDSYLAAAVPHLTPVATLSFLCWSTQQK